MPEEDRQVSRFLSQVVDLDDEDDDMTILL